ncbi:MAG: ribonuclease HI family protein [Candidatus Bathyarchaeia archaeon]|jgi:ribonuclease HI
MFQRLFLYSDGGARGNPGPAAIAYLALTEKGETVKADSLFIGTHTNNQSEYNALIAALEFAAANKVEEVVCYLDSELVAKQLKGEYSVKNFELQKLWRRAQELKRCFKKTTFVNVPRTNVYIQRADALVNKTLDEQSENNSN